MVVEIIILSVTVSPKILFVRFVGVLFFFPAFVVVDATTFMIETYILSHSAHEQCCKEREVRKKEREPLKKETLINGCYRTW